MEHVTVSSQAVYKSSVILKSGLIYARFRGVAFEIVPINNTEVTTHKIFCMNLSRRRTELELTQQDVADRLGISPRKYQSYEYAHKTGGKPWPRPERIDELAKILKCDPSEFFKKIPK